MKCAFTQIDFCWKTWNSCSVRTTPKVSPIFYHSSGIEIVAGFNYTHTKFLLEKAKNPNNAVWVVAPGNKAECFRLLFPIDASLSPPEHPETMWRVNYELPRSSSREQILVLGVEVIPPTTTPAPKKHAHRPR